MTDKQNSDHALDTDNLFPLNSIKEGAAQLSQSLMDYTNYAGDSEADIQNQKKALSSKTFRELQNFSQRIYASKKFEETVPLIFQIIACWKNYLASVEAAEIDNSIPKHLSLVIEQFIARAENDTKRIMEDIPNTLNSFVNNERLKLTKIISDFEISVRERQIALQKLIKDTQTEVQQLQPRLKEKLNAADALYQENKTKLDGHMQDIEKLVGAISETGLSGDFKRRAVLEGKIADQFRKYTIWAMFAVAVITLFILIHTLDGNISPGQAILKAVTLLVISAFPAYLARESNKHRNYQYHFRQTALDISGISPYLSRLDKDDRDKILVGLAPKLFTRHAHMPSSSSEDHTETTERFLRIFEKGITKS